jgi:predicted small lipoprotein YifL
MKKIFHSISIVSTLFLLSACSNTPTVIATTIKNLTGCENVDVKKNYPN